MSGKAAQPQVPAPEEHLVTHHITSTSFHLNITILLHKTMVQLDDTCNTVLPSRLECLGCKGISAVPYPSPTGEFWYISTDYNYTELLVIFKLAGTNLNCKL